VLQKPLQQFGCGVDFQPPHKQRERQVPVGLIRQEDTAVPQRLSEVGIDEKKPRSMNRGGLGSTATSHSVELAKFTQGFRSFAAFFHAGFFVIFPPFQLAFDTVDLQFLFQLPDRVFKVTSDIYFDHIASLPLVVGRSR
jgi:hypothetical protein